MNATDALSDAAVVWRSPDDMVEQWEGNAWKKHHEELVAEWCTVVSTVADVGCGNGRYVRAIEYTKGYYGYDASQRMLDLAAVSPWKLATFTCVDVLAYQSDMWFEAVLFIDVAQHYPDPIGAIKTMLMHWKGRHYYISLVCGACEEVLSATTVVSYHRLLELWDVDTGMKLNRMYMERFDGARNLTWVLLDLVR